MEKLFKEEKGVPNVKCLMAVMYPLSGTLEITAFQLALLRGPLKSSPVEIISLVC